MSKGGYIVEMHKVGNAVKVSAMDPATLTEVSIVGDPRLSQKRLTDAAVQKLEYVLQKKK